MFRLSGWQSKPSQGRSRLPYPALAREARRSLRIPPARTTLTRLQGPEFASFLSLLFGAKPQRFHYSWIVASPLCELREDFERNLLNAWLAVEEPHRFKHVVGIRRKSH